MSESYRTPFAVLGRLLLAAIFLLSPLANLIPNFSSTVIAMEKAGVPVPAISLAIAIAILIAGSLALISGYYARIGALLLALFLLPATYFFHDPWSAADAAEASGQTVHLLKNAGLFGALLFIAVTGPGPGSLGEARR
jgi:putative oxidoreductase